jgi:glycosyltransferase involved in cell wall biosynthesis
MESKEDRIAIVSEGDMRSIGGAEKYIIELTRRLDRYKRCKIRIFSHQSRKYANKAELDVAVASRITFYKSIELPLVRERLPFTLSGLRMLASLRDFDVIYNVDPSLFTNLYLIALSRISGKKVIFGMHDPGVLRDEPIQSTFLRRKLLGGYKLFRNFVFLKIDNIHVVNGDDERHLKELGYRGKIHYIPDFIPMDVKSVPLRHNNREFVVLFIGKLDTIVKGIDLLAKSMDYVLERNKNVHFHLCGSEGDGKPLISKVMEKYPGNVKWLGFVSNKRLQDEYSRASLAAVTARSDTSSLVVLESQCHGLPVIAFNIRGPRDILKSRMQGSLIAPFDADLFGAAILDYYGKWLHGSAYGRNKAAIKKMIEREHGTEHILPMLARMFSA